MFERLLFETVTEFYTGLGYIFLSLFHLYFYFHYYYWYYYNYYYYYYYYFTQIYCSDFEFSCSRISYYLPARHVWKKNAYSRKFFALLWHRGWLDFYPFQTRSKIRELSPLVIKFINLIISLITVMTCNITPKFIFLHTMHGIRGLMFQTYVR